MNTFKLVIGIFFLIGGAEVNASSGVAGNGGDVVWCSSGSPFKLELLDFYEAKIFDPQFQIDLGGNRLSLEQKIDYNLNKIFPLSKLRAQLYRTQLNEFLKQVMWTDQELTDIEDSNHLFLPPNCKIRQIAILIPENQNLGFKYIINKKLWELLTLDQKVGLMFHEVIYQEARTFKHENSVEVRKLNSWIASSKFSKVTQEEFDSFLENAKLPLYLQNPIYPELYLSGFENKNGIASAYIALESTLVVGDQRITLLPGAYIRFYKDSLKVSYLELRGEITRIGEGGRPERVKVKYYKEGSELKLFGASIPIDDLFYSVDYWDLSVRFNLSGELIGANRFRSVKPIFVDIPIHDGFILNSRLHSDEYLRGESGLKYSELDDSGSYEEEQYYLSSFLVSRPSYLEINSLPVRVAGVVYLYPDKRIKRLNAQPGSQFYLAGFPNTIITVQPGDSDRLVYLDQKGMVVNFGWDPKRDEFRFME